MYAYLHGSEVVRHLQDSTVRSVEPELRDCTTTNVSRHKREDQETTATLGNEALSASPTLLIQPSLALHSLRYLSDQG